MKRILSFATVALIAGSFTALSWAQQPTTTEKKTTTTPAKVEPKATMEHKAMMTKTEHLKLTRDEIIALQNALISAKVYTGKATGTLDVATKRALRRYQQDNKLKVTGQPDEETLNKLGVSYTPSSAHTATRSMTPAANTKQPAAKKNEPVPPKPDSKQN